MKLSKKQVTPVASIIWDKLEYQIYCDVETNCDSMVLFDVWNKAWSPVREQVQLPVSTTVQNRFYEN